MAVKNRWLAQRPYNDFPILNANVHCSMIILQRWQRGICRGALFPAVMDQNMRNNTTRSPKEIPYAVDFITVFAYGHVLWLCTAEIRLAFASPCQKIWHKNSLRSFVRLDAICGCFY